MFHIPGSSLTSVFPVVGKTVAGVTLMKLVPVVRPRSGVPVT